MMIRLRLKWQFDDDHKCESASPWKPLHGDVLQISAQPGVWMVVIILFFIIVLKHIDDYNVLVNLHEGWVLIPWVVVSEVRISRWSCRWCCGCCCCCCRCGRGCCRGWSGGWRAGCGGRSFVLGEVDRHLDVAQSILSQSSSNFWSRIFSSSKF